jgi:hypothetical protein
VHFSPRIDHDKQCVRVKDRERLLTFYGFPRRALETHPHQQPHRKHLRHRALANRENQKLPRPENNAGYGLQTDLERQAQMAEARRVKPIRRPHRRSTVQGRNQANQIRHRIVPLPTFDHSSKFLIFISFKLRLLLNSIGNLRKGLSAQIVRHQNPRSFG